MRSHRHLRDQTWQNKKNKYRGRSTPLACCCGFRSVFAPIYKKKEKKNANEIPSKKTGEACWHICSCKKKNASSSRWHFPISLAGLPSEGTRRAVVNIKFDVLLVKEGGKERPSGKTKLGKSQFEFLFRVLSEQIWGISEGIQSDLVRQTMKNTFDIYDSESALTWFSVSDQRPVGFVKLWLSLPVGSCCYRGLKYSLCLSQPSHHGSL